VEDTIRKRHVYTPSLSIYILYLVCPKSNLDNLDQIYRKKSNYYTNQNMHYQNIFHAGFNETNSVLVNVFFLEHVGELRIIGIINVIIFSINLVKVGQV